MNAIGWAERCFRWLMRAYPPRFQRRHGLALFELFRDDARAANAAGGALGVARALGSAAIDVLVTAPGSWLRRDESESSRSRRRFDTGAWVADARLAVRHLRQAPGFVALAVLMLSVGIGANTALFALANAILFKPIALADPDHVVRVTGRTANGLVTNRFVFPEIESIGMHAASLASVATVSQSAFAMSVDGRQEEVLGEIVSGSYFDLLGARATIGRVLTSADDRDAAAPVAVISERLWRQRFDASPSLLGRSVLLNGTQRSIVGVIDDRFNGAFVGAAVDVWTTIASSASELGTRWRTDTGKRQFVAVGRLQSGATAARAEAELQALVTSVPGVPAAIRIARVEISPGTLAFGNQRRLAAIFLGTLAVLVALVLVAVCANIANLVLARLVGRRRELAIRVALGATRGQLARLLAIESAMLAAIGGAGALLVSGWASAAASAIKPLPTVALHFDTRLDVRIAAFATLVTLAAAAALSLAGVAYAVSPHIAPALKDDSAGAIGARSGMRVRGALVVLQMTVSLVLMISSALFVRSARNAQRIDLGMDPAGVVALDVDHARQADSAAARVFFDRVLRRLAGSGAVDSAAVSTRAPLDSSTPITHVSGSGPISADASAPIASFLTVSPRYFDVVRTPIVEGRAFSDRDDEHGQAVAIVNETLARRFWPDGSAIGRRLWLDGHASAVPCLVVGIARNSRYVTLGEEGQAHVYVPFAQQPRLSMTILVRSARQTDRAIAAIRDALAAENPDVQGFFARTLAEHLAVSLLPVRLATQLAVSVAIVGILLAMIGLYGLVSFLVAERTPEFGLRLALGASPTALVRMIVAYGARMSAIGIAVGLPLAVMTMRLLRTLLYGVSPADPLSLILVTAAVIAMTIASCVIPAIRIARLDPRSALRS